MLSVIIPVYRVEQTLHRCVESVASQTFTDMEIILVDDGSPDRCPQLCDEWAQRDPRIRVIHKRNGGLSDARNAGLDLARGDVVTFVDSDDFLDADTYRQVVPLMDEGTDIVEFPLVRHYGSKREECVTFPHQSYTDMGRYWLRARAYEHTYAWNKIYRRELFSDVRFPRGKVFEDVWTLPLLLDRARRVTTADCGLYYYCDNTEGITATAGGHELRMLLDAHRSVMTRWCDDRYYMHVLDRQLDVSRLTGSAPLLTHRFVNPLAQGLTATQRLKALALNTIGIKGLCRINRTIHGSR